MSEWQTGFRKFALIVLKDHFHKDPISGSPEAIATYCREQIILDEDDPKERYDQMAEMRAPMYWRQWEPEVKVCTYVCLAHTLTVDVCRGGSEIPSSSKCWPSRISHC